jgi:DNA-binding response OmpR family regulator
VKTRERARIEFPSDAAALERLADRLELRAPTARPTPSLDHDGILRFRDRVVVLSPVEERLARALVDASGSIVDRSNLLADRRNGQPSTIASLRTRVARLRRRIEPLGLTVRSVRGRGYVVETSDGQTI